MKPRRKSRVSRKATGTVPGVGFILPMGTGYRWKTVVLDCRDFPRDVLKKKIAACFGGSSGRTKPAFVFVGHTELVSGLHRLLGNSPAVVLADFVYRRPPGVPHSRYRRLSNREFDRLDAQREKLNGWLGGLSGEEMVDIFLKRHLARDRTLQMRFRRICRLNALPSFGIAGYRAYLESKFGREVIREMWRAEFLERYVDENPVMTRLRYNELTHAAGVLFWNKRHAHLSRAFFPELSSKFWNILPFMPLSGRPGPPSLKWKLKRLLVFARKTFNNEGELSGVRLLNVLPRPYSLDIVGIGKREFLGGLRGVEDYAALKPVLRRVRFHVDISPARIESLLRNAFFMLKLSVQGMNNMGLCEALAHGTPIVTIRGRMDRGLMMHGRNAFLFRHQRLTGRDLRVLRRKLLFLSRSPARYREMSRAAYETGRGFDIKYWGPWIFEKLGLVSQERPAARR